MADDGLVLNLSYNEPVQVKRPAPQHRQWPPQQQQRAPASQPRPASATKAPQPRPVSATKEPHPHPSSATKASEPRPVSVTKPPLHQAAKQPQRPEKQVTKAPAPETQTPTSEAVHSGGHNRSHNVGHQQEAGTRAKRQPQWKSGSRGRPNAAATAAGQADADAQMRGADDDEDGDVAAMVAAVAQRDKQLEQDLSRSSHHHKPVTAGDAAVVEFGDDNDDEGGPAAKRRKFSEHSAAHKGQGAGGSRPGHKAADAALQRVAAARPMRVGALTHVDQQPGAASAQIFGTDTSSWEGLGLESRLVEQLRAANFENPTRVQQESIPVLLGGKDALVKAATGSGKTLAYLVPMIHDLQAQRISRSDGTYGIVIAPTRELCIQIQDVAKVLLQRLIWIVTSLLIGGEHLGHEKARLRKGVTIVVATPGRLQDHLEHTASFKTSELRWLVLDEADRLLDLGFQVKLREIIHLLDTRPGSSAAAPPPLEEGAEGQAGAGRRPGHGGRRTTVLLSATLHQGLGALASEIQREPVAVGFSVKRGPSGLHVSEEDAAAGGSGGVVAALEQLGPGRQSEFSIPSQLRQAFMEVPCKDRLMALAGVLRQKLLMKKLPGVVSSIIGPEKQTKGKPATAAAVSGKAPAAGGASGGAGGGGRKVVVFIACCDGVELLHAVLGSCWEDACGAPLLAAPLLKLHGDMPQPERTAAFLQFNQAKSAVLLCTDVAARGLDFPDVSTIVQYDVPGAPEEYVHRVGRTARMGHGGEALLLLMPHERPYVELLSQRGISLQEDSLVQALKWLPPPPDSEKRNMPRPSKSRDGDITGATALACAVQRAVLQAVARNAEVSELAGNAFRSFVKAYATHPRNVKYIFNVRQLHLGHVAFSYGLKDTPLMIGSTGSSAERKRKKHETSAAAQKQAKKKLYANAQHTAGFKSRGGPSNLS